MKISQTPLTNPVDLSYSGPVSGNWENEIYKDRRKIL